MFNSVSLNTCAVGTKVVSVEQDQKLTATLLYPSGPVRNRPLVALHGISRDARALADHFAPEADAAGRVIIVPRFARKHWPVFQRITHRHRPDRALLALVADLRLRNVITSEAFDLFGFSGGAQLAHRFAMLHPEHVADLHLGAAGWYTLPDASMPYPMGLGPSTRGDDRWGRRMASGLAAYLDRRIVLYVGGLDDDPNDPALRRKPELDMAQGTTRLVRARRYAEAIRDLQLKNGVPATCALHELPGCSHDFADCAENGGLTAFAARPAAEKLN
ncbi:MAG: alpha/beta hydrolase [Pseudomonadota bacterium]